MNNVAYAEICGQLGADIQIKDAKNGKKYGILTVAVNKSKKDPETDRWVAKTDWFKIHVWNQAILDSGAAVLKKGEKVLVIGELRTIKKPVEEGVTEVGQHSITTINVKKRSGITILKKNFPTIEEDKNSMLEENSGTDKEITQARSA